MHKEIRWLKFFHFIHSFTKFSIIFSGNMPPPMGLRGGGSNHLGLPSSSRRASSASVMQSNFHGPVQKKRSIPNMGKRGSNSSGVGISGLVIPPPKIVKVMVNF